MTVAIRLVQVDTVGTAMCSRSVLGDIDVAYTAYGHDAGSHGSLPLLRFNGQHREPASGHYQLGNGYRAYSPILMRFNSPDSYSPFGEGDVNAYVYCGGNPVYQRDPSGHVGEGVRSGWRWRSARPEQLPKAPGRRVSGTSSVSMMQSPIMAGSDGASKVSAPVGKRAEASSTSANYTAVTSFGSFARSQASHAPFIESVYRSASTSGMKGPQVVDSAPVSSPDEPSFVIAVEKHAPLLFEQHRVIVNMKDLHAGVDGAKEIRTENETDWFLY